MSMSMEKQLFWILQEEDINNENLFFPPDTPIKNINLPKLKAKLRNRHVRELKRLEYQQIEELRRCQKKFSERYDHQVYLSAPPPSCEFINGLEFLKEYGTELTSLTMAHDNNVSQVSSIESENNAEEENQRNTKSMIEDRKLEYANAFKRRFRDRFDALDNNHSKQVEYLRSMQNDEISKLNDSIYDQTKYDKKLKKQEDLRLQRIKDMERDNLEKERLKLKQLQLEQLQKQILEQHQQLQSLRQDGDNNITPMKRKWMSNNNESGSPPTSPHLKSNTQPSRNRKLINNNDVNNIVTSPPPSKGRGKYTPAPIQAPGIRGKPPVPSSTRGLPPVVVTTPLPSKTIPAVSVSDHSKNQRGGKKKKQSMTRQQRSASTSTPLFPQNQRRPVNGSSEVLTDTGTIAVVRKPNRVVIRSNNGAKNIGDPKDYNDAINGYRRTTENPVTKRQYYGQQHLFYKTKTGEIVNVGPVSEIQPLINSFLLSS